MESKPFLVVFDGYSLLYRAYHALPPTMSTRSGEPTNAVYGFTSMVLNVLREWKPTHAVVAMDSGPSWRVAEEASYKANRPETPSDFLPQVERARQIMEALGIPVLACQSWEADDIIGSVTCQARRQGAEVLIVTGDHDALQLVGEGVRVLASGRRFSDTMLFDERAVQERYGLKPRQLIDYKALVGDKTDNVPGVHGIGEKTAVQLLQRFGCLDGVYEHLAELPDRIRAALEGSRAQVALSKRLVTIRCDAPVRLDLSECRVGRFDHEALTRLLRELEFRSLVGKLEELTGATQLRFFSAPQPAPEPSEGRVPVEWQIVTTRDQLQELANELSGAAAIGLDVETDGLDPISAGLVGVSVASGPGRSFYIPLNHELGPNARLEDVQELLLPILRDRAKERVGHNTKFDWELLTRHGLMPAEPSFDTMLAEWILNPDSRSLSLKALAWSRLGWDMTPITELIGRGKKQRSMAQVGVAEAAPYAAADAAAALALRAQQERELRERNQLRLLQEIEMPLVPVLVEMELTGVKIDVDYLRQLSVELEDRLRGIVLRIQQIAGYPINVNSPQQLGDFLFKQLGLQCESMRRTKTGQASTAAEILEELRGEHEVIDLILEQRQIAKLKSTYIDALPQLVNARTGRVHTSYNQTGTVTGRLSSSEPNLQNIPIRTEQGRLVRKAFIAEAGNILLSADYSQIELRILAHVADEPALQQAFARDLDVHAHTASLLYGVPLDAVTPEMRRIAKTVNFAIIYGVSPFGLARQSDLTQSEAELFISAYFRNYPKVKEYIERTKALAAERGFVETLFGRRRYFPELAPDKALPKARRAEAERAAINTPIQGTAADIIKIAMIQLARQLQERQLRTKMILQVHDELVLEGPEEEAEEVASLVREIMEGACALKVPLKVDVAIGHNWLEMEPVKL